MMLLKNINEIMRSRKISKKDILSFGKYKHNALYGENTNKCENYVIHFFKKHNIKINVISIKMGYFSKYENNDCYVWNCGKIFIKSVIPYNELNSRSKRIFKKFKEICFQNEMHFIYE